VTSYTQKHRLRHVSGIWIQQYRQASSLIGDDFNVELDSNDNVSVGVNNFNHINQLYPVGLKHDGTDGPDGTA